MALPGMEMQGFKKLNAVLKKIATVTPDQVANGLYAEGELMMTESQRQVPVDQGPLKGSKQVILKRAGLDSTVILGYGGPAIPYARRQHEELDWQHEVGKAKFLEDPVVDAIPGLEVRIAKRCV